MTEFFCNIFLVCICIAISCSISDTVPESSSGILSITMTTKLSSFDIDKSLNKLRQDDPKLINILRDKYLIPPSNMSYNFSASTVELNGQSGQPEYVANTFYRSQENHEQRFFVEAGAFDGEIISNSLYFEAKLGWSGVLIEPNPAAFNMLLTKHRKAWSINACLSRQIFPEIIEFDLNGIVGGIINKNRIRPGDLQSKEKNAHRDQEKIYNRRRGIDEINNRWDSRVDGSVVEEKVQLQCFPLYSILKALDKNTIDYLSLDVEGAEYGIIEALFNGNGDLKFNVAGIETTYLGRAEFGSNALEMVYLMRRNGYQLQNHIGQDDFYVHKSFEQIESRYKAY